MTKQNQIIIFIAILSSIFLSTGIYAQTYQNGILQGAIQVKISPLQSSNLKSIKSTRKGIETGIVAFDAVSQQISAQKMERLFPYSPKFEERHRAYGLHLWYRVEFDESINPYEVAKQYSQLDEVESADVIGKVELVEPSQSMVAEAQSVGSGDFNDPNLGGQWHYNNTGSKDWAEEGADINLEEAWKMETGSSDVIVAVVDGGIQTDHPDLHDALWTNDAELNGSEGIDDDGNGYVDDIYGYNFVLKQGELVPHYHGTHVAGTVGAINNNQIGVSGIAGGNGDTPGVRLMSCQIFTEDGDAGGYAEAIIYAADMGAVISQNSWGWGDDGVYEQSVLDAIDYFNETAGSYDGSPMKGGVSIFAAGNKGYDLDIYPAAYENCIAVSAIGPDFKRAPYSVYSNWVDIAAPGGNTNYGTEAGVLSTYKGSTYGYLQGTSMACPHVSGIAALVVSKFKADDFTAHDLKYHILSSVKNLEPYLEENEIGKMGGGYIDAAMALQSGDPNITPDAVKSLQVAPSQDFASLTWNVPADGDDEKASSYLLFWNDAPFTEATLQSAGSKVVNAFFANVGDEVNAVIEDLEATTEYYFAIKALDRWGNESDLSEVIKTATNNGPVIEMGEDLSLSIDVSADPNSNTTYTFSNIGEGVLNWDAHVGLSAFEADIFDQSNIIYPNFNRIPNTLGVGEVNSSVDMVVNAPALLDIDDRMRYVEYANYATKAIGENDTSITNSVATWYKVENEDGFNLTSMWINLNWDGQTGPIVVEIWKGSNLKEAELISAQNYNYDGDSWTTHYITLEEQIFFDYGEVFWTVVHVPSGNLYPIGIQEEQEEDYSERCFMSFNGGVSWESMSSVINSEKYVLSWSMQSTQSILTDHITISPDNGILNSGQTQDVSINIDATELVDGVYDENIVIISNDPSKKVARGKIQLDVDGHQPKLSSTKTVDFGLVFLGSEKTFDIQIVNEGLRGLRLSKDAYTSSNPTVFVAENVVSGDDIPALEEGWVRVTFNPTEEGVFTSKINIENEDGITHSLTVYGVGAVPAKIRVEDKTTLTNEITIPGDFNVGDALPTQSFTITNDGKYPLQYRIPKFSTDYEIEGIEKPLNNFGYTYSTAFNAGTASREENGWIDITSSGVDVTDQLEGPDYAVLTDIGFSFPFRDTLYNKVWINEQGALIFGTDNGNVNLDYVSGSSLNAAYLRDFDMITATMVNAKYTASGAKITYQKEEGAFRVQYHNITYLSTVSVDMEIVLYANGDVDVLFAKSTYVESYLIAIVDKANQDICLVHNSDYPSELGKGQSSSNTYNDWIHIYHPGEPLINSVTNPSGTIEPNESVDIDVTFNTDDVLEGNIYERLAIYSNDPTAMSSTYIVNTNIVGGGTPELRVDVDSIQYGDVYKTDELILNVQIENQGTANAYINDIQFKIGGLFSTTSAGLLPVLVKPRQSVFIPVKIETGLDAYIAKGNINDTIVVTTDNNNTYDVSLWGNVIEYPVLSINPVSGISHEMKAEEIYDTQFEIVNAGDGELEYAIVPNKWYYPKENVDASATMNFNDIDYIYEKGDGKGWIDITESAAETNLESKFLDDYEPYVAVKLNKPFTYYGQSYETMYISMCGWMSFIEPEVDQFDYRPYRIPDQDNMAGVICPLSAFHVPYYYSDSQKQGIYYQQDDDKIIVSWEEYFPVAGGREEYSFQAVLYDNGSIDFNYKNMYDPRISGIIGIENPNEEDGLFIYSGYFSSGDVTTGEGLQYSYSIYPVKKKTLAANSSEIIDLRLDATQLIDGTYSSEIQVKNNTIGEEEKSIPILLKVNGTANVVAEGNDLGVVWYVEGQSYEKRFTITNTGTKTLELDHAKLTGNNDIKVEYYYPAVSGGFYGDLAPEGTADVVDFVGSPLIIKILSKLGYVPYQVADGSFIEPEQVWEMVVTYTPSIAELASTKLQFFDAADQVVFNCDIQIESKMPAAATVNEESMTVYADTDEYTESREINIGNILGVGDLIWDADIIFNRGAYLNATVSNTGTASLKSTKVTPQLQQGEYSILPTGTLKATEEDTYNRQLVFTDKDTRENNIGFGAGLAFISGSKFQAPSDGFLLSHIETYFIHEKQLNGVISVEIRAGSDNISTAISVANGQMTFSYDEVDDNVGSWATIELDKPVYLFPNEEFFVIINYPLGISLPQGVVYLDTEESLNNQCFFNYMGDWIDLTTQSGFTKSVFLVKALEKEYDVRTWLSIDPEYQSGVTAVGEETTMTLNFNAANVQEIKNNATLIINTNDPLHEQLAVDMNLFLNEAPYVTLTEGTPIVKETESLTISFTVVDKEGDSFTTDYISTVDWASFTTNAVDGSTVVYATFTPGYDDQGIHDFDIVLKDEHGVEGTYEFQVQVVNVNRAPEFIMEPADTIVMLEHGDFEIQFADVITDVDKDDMEYEFSISDESVIELLSNEQSAILKPFTIGNTEVFISGTDSHGAKVEGSYTITVRNRVGLDSKEDIGLEIYPNPVTDILRITTKDTYQEVNVRVLNTNGTLMYSDIIDQLGIEEYVINTKDLIAGVYVVEVVMGDHSYIQKVVKY